MPLSSRKEDRMKKSTIQKEKIDNVGIHSFSKKSNFFFTLLLTLVGLTCVLPFIFVVMISLTDEQVWQSMASNSGQQNLDLMVTSSWYNSKTKSCKPSSLPCLWPLWEQHVMSLSPQLMLTLSHGVPLNTASSLPYFHSLVCSLVQGWFQATLSPLNSCS